MCGSRKLFPKKDRMRAQWEFKQVRHAGMTFPGRYIVFSIFTLCDNHERRIGFIANKRIGNAVTRNRIKRWLREIYRLHRAQFKEGIRLVLIARQAIVHASFSDVENEILQLNQLFMSKS